jgi:hypothetical protein
VRSAAEDNDNKACLLGLRYNKIVDIAKHHLLSLKSDKLLHLVDSQLGLSFGKE